ncbi:DUF1002 domain-containing protein [Pullulanibacillus sp. KACC 23026]|uniref:DUF1002 domain-containing protein n=1 Tax=Pullulanibacillus sp. KACC 23026 TaxID=3028315 RepID=UPI0023AF9224|nr:DUF1002 domain-containing protein [Pullulanibacillus sp. KACC 23026]WEG14678.1 DUF1002 domain-containing protein [Pullulanibacillus sp. KACC 23026]
MKKILVSIGIAVIGLGLMLPSFSSIAKADAVPGDIIVTLGQDLTADQQNQVLNDMGVNKDDVQIVYVNNSEEHQYLDKYVPQSEIGTKSISCAEITLGNKGDGLVVQTNNITYITSDMYRNALSTAGVTDAKIYVTAPFPVSGTGALTGIIKAYEKSSGSAINETQKQAANEEMAQTAQLASKPDVGQDKAVQFMQQVKEQISKQKPQTTDQLRSLIQQVADNMGIKLTADELNQLVDLFNKIKNLNIDWTKVNQTYQTAKAKWDQFSNSDQGKSIISSFLAFLKSIGHAIMSFFSKS